MKLMLIQTVPAGRVPQVMDLHPWPRAVPIWQVAPNHEIHWLDVVVEMRIWTTMVPVGHVASAPEEMPTDLAGDMETVYILAPFPF